MSDIVKKESLDLQLEREESFNIQLDESDLVIKRWTNKFGFIEISFWSIFFERRYIFFGNEVTKTLGFGNPRDALERHCDPEDISTVEETFGKNFRLTLKRYFQGCREFRHPLFFQNLQPHQKVINEFAIYGLCIGSKLPCVKPFRRWVYNTIHEIRETGSYSLSGFQNLSLEESPKEKIESTYIAVPDFVFEDKKANEERRELNKAFTKGKELSKDLEQSEKGSLGGIEKDRRDKNRIKLLVKIFNSKDLQDENLKKELEEIIMSQKLLEIEFE